MTSVRARQPGRGVPAFLDSPMLHLLVSAVLFSCCLYESVWEYRELEHIRIGGHHGLLVFAGVEMSKRMAEVVHHLKGMLEGH